MSHKRHRIRPVVERVTQVLRQRVMYGQYAPGSLFPSERALAGELGVSRMSVSRALEQLVREGVAEQRVGAGSRVCPLAARRLPPGRIAVLHGPFSRTVAAEPSLILQGIIDTLVGQQFLYEIITLVDSEYRGPAEASVRASEVPRLRPSYGGFIFLENHHVGEIQKLQRAGVALVVANLEQEMTVNATWVDHRRIALTAVEFLAALGHRRIGLVATRPGHAFYTSTIAGYKEGLRRLQMSDAEELISLCPSSSPLEAYTATQVLLRRRPRPTAIVAGRDLHAEGICRAAEEHKLRIGHDLSVIGYDDVSWAAGSDLLTTFQEPCYELGSMAARMLIDRVRNPSPKIEKREIPAPLILRRSAGPPEVIHPLDGGRFPDLRLHRLPRLQG